MKLREKQASRTLHSQINNVNSSIKNLKKILIKIELFKEGSMLYEKLLESPEKAKAFWDTQNQKILQCFEGWQAYSK